MKFLTNLLGPSGCFPFPYRLNFPLLKVLHENSKKLSHEVAVKHEGTKIRGQSSFPSPCLFTWPHFLCLDLLKKISEVFEVTADYLVFDDMENVGPINLKDKSLYEKMKLIDELEEKDRTIIHGVIDAFLVKQQMWNVLNKQVNLA